VDAAPYPARIRGSETAWLFGRAATLPPRLLLDRSLDRWLDLEALVRDWKTALDRNAVRSGGQSLLRALHRSQLVAKVVDATDAELVLVEIRRLVGEMLIATRELGVFSRLCELREPAFDPRPLGGEQLPCASILQRRLYRFRVEPGTTVRRWAGTAVGGFGSGVKRISSSWRRYST
jgi:hypothetical protein